MNPKYEDVILLASVVLGAIASALTNDPKYVTIGLVLGAIGKALGSLYPSKTVKPSPP